MRLMPAFSTPSGLPNSTINLATGASSAMPWANGGAVLSELGSVQLELVCPPGSSSGCCARHQSARVSLNEGV